MDAASGRFVTQSRMNAGGRPWRRPWEVARWGRLLAGAGVILFTTLGLCLDPLWNLGTLFIAANLFVTALTDRCPVRDTLLRLGAKEREDLFLPGGKVRGDHSDR
ncbi:MAG: DUF2892 domain-containing protein [Planctomycetes bacterium]|nr:DUF2892 domain-containing protein [Planctomycetota bacterium]